MSARGTRTSYATLPNVHAETLWSRAIHVPPGLKMQSDRRVMAVLFCFFAFLYAWFFQGGGGNQNSQFDSIRAIVERGTVDITPFAANTEDSGEYKGRIYSNKLPGLAFAATSFYLAAYHLELFFGIDPASFVATNFNSEWITFMVSGVPGVLLVLTLFLHFRRKKASTYEALFLASAFGVGSLLLPYSGVMMDHLLTACVLFASWHIVSAPELRANLAIAAGLLSGMAILTDALAWPAAGLVFLYVVAKQRHAFKPFLLGALPLVLALLEYNYLCFDSILRTNHSIMADEFKTPGYLSGVLYWPEPIRLFWLTIHPFRGLFYCCPVLLIGLLSLRWPLRIQDSGWETAIPLLIFAYYLLFNMSFNGWTGGWAFGPRYLIPAMAFLYAFALPGYRRFRAVSCGLAAISAVFMLSVTAVNVMLPAHNSGPPPPMTTNPVFDSIRDLLAGQISVSTQVILSDTPDFVHSKWASYNLGELIGLTGLWSLLPVMPAFLGFAWYANRLRITYGTS